MITSGERVALGDIEVVRLLDGTFRVDGGAMFGVVPRSLWARRAAPDAENRVTLALNCYLVRTPGATILLDTGVGPDVDRRHTDFYSFDRRPGLFESLAELGLDPDDIDIVVNSHLHFDHCGGNTIRTPEGKWVPAFPKARYVVQRGEWDQALHPVERDKPSYMPARLKPLAETGRLVLLDGGGPIAAGVETFPVVGHTAFHQGVKVASGGKTFFYLADAVPTAAHIDLDTIMSYDLYPVDTFNAKKGLLARAEAEGWILGFSHEVRHPFGTVRRRGRRWDFVPAAAAPAPKPFDFSEPRLYDGFSKFRGGSFMKKVTVEELLAKARQPSLDAPRLHKFYKGKMGTALKCRVRDFNDFAIWYTPGVAAVCKEIQADKQKAYEYTNKWNSVAVISDGTRVLGLGDIGPEAGLPVMEGKGILYKYLGGVDAFPICLDEKDPDKLIEICRALQPSFGGYNLEDISQPKCFRILDELRAKCEIPVWHDDQQGTACVTVAGLINALKIVKKDIAEVKCTVVGSGASGINIARQIILAGANPDNMLSVDSKGILSRDRADKETLQAKFKEKWDLCLRTNPKCKQGSVADAIKGADVLICCSTPGPGTVKPEWVKGMAKNAIVFAEANPIPEIWPWEAKEAGARIVATGRSDFPNQVNNSLGFPGIFRGALDVRAKTITDGMCLAAARELAKVAEDKGIHEEYIIPNMDEWEVFPREAVAVGSKAIEEGVARFNFPADVRFKMAENMIRASREDVQKKMKEGIIIDPDK